MTTQTVSERLPLMDTHTHFDADEFDCDRQHQAELAYQAGVESLLLIGYVAKHFERLLAVQDQLNAWHAQGGSPYAHVAAGLHPFYSPQHQIADMAELEAFLKAHTCVAVGEIGLDTYLPSHKEPSAYARQVEDFRAQLELARQFGLPVLLHIRRSHADVLRLLKETCFQNGGIAHSFSGGIEEAKSLIKLGFKLGVTGQVTNPNAKRLRQVVQAVGPDHVVIETDCPDMTPLCCQKLEDVALGRQTRNVPANLAYVLDGLAALLGRDREVLAEQVWRNSRSSLHLPVAAWPR